MRPSLTLVDAVQGPLDLESINSASYFGSLRPSHELESTNVRPARAGLEDWTPSDPMSLLGPEPSRHTVPSIIPSL